MKLAEFAAVLGAACGAVALVTACSSSPPSTDTFQQPAPPPAARTVEIQRTEHGIAHVEAPDYESLAYGVAYAHAADNLCQSANELVTIRGERSRFFGADGQGLLGLRVMDNRTIDIFIRGHMDDAALAKAQAAVSPEAQAMARGYVGGYNRYLRDHAVDAPAPCGGQPWLRSMTAADYLRLQELTMIQIGIGLMADAVVAAAPPDSTSPAADPPPVSEAAFILEGFGFDKPALGSNGWAFGSEVTENGRGVLLGNPHFPWAGVNRFWEMHLTIPGKLDVMGAAIGHSPVVQIGFNKDVAWTHTVSTGKRFTLFELKLVPGKPTRYLVDGEEVPMSPETVSFDIRDANGDLVPQQHTIWNTRYGPVIVVPKAGLDWSTLHAYALQDVNVLNMRGMDIWVGFDKAKSVEEMRDVLARLGVPWVNTIAADRHGKAMYADVSAVPDVDAEQLRACAPSERAAALFKAAGLAILDGSRSACDWHRDADSPVPGLIPIERMPVAIRRDWVQNSNDSFWLSNPDIDWPPFSPLVGATRTQQSLRTRAGLYAIQTRLAGDDGIAEHGKVGLDEVQAMLFQDRNHTAYLVLDDLLAACDNVRTEPSEQACDVLADWDRRTDVDSRGEHLFREWWRAAINVENVWRIPFDPDHPETTPAGLNMTDPEVHAQVFALLDDAVATVRQAGFALDAPLGDLQHHATNDGVIGLPGGPEFEGVLNKVETSTNTLEPGGYEVNFGSSYIQTVTFDEDGPVAEAIMTYGQSPRPGSPYYFDQLSMFAAKDWLELPFAPEDVAAHRVGEPITLTVE